MKRTLTPARQDAGAQGGLKCYVGALVSMAHDPSAKVRQMVAENMLTPILVLDELCCDTDPQVRLSAGENPRTSYPSVLGLVEDESCDLRYALAENHNLPSTILQQLANDDNPFVSDRARRTLSRCHGAQVHALKPGCCQPVKSHMAV